MRPQFHSKATRLWRGIGVAMAMSMALSLVGAGSVFAATDVNSPGKVQSDTVRLHWTGQGTTGGDLNSNKCDENADFGAGGAQNGATADDYLLWIFNSDGGSITGNVTITINGTTYGDAFNNHQIVTPGYEPEDITDAHANFTVNTTGSGKWVLTISHGCNGFVEDLPWNPSASIEGPCADPAYYGIFDNSANSTPTKFRYTWWNGFGFNVFTKWVPAGMTYTTYDKWAKPNTMIRIHALNPNTGNYVKLDEELTVKGRFPQCDVPRGFSQPNQ